ncbi:MAG: hypothetical protein AAFW66_04575 [Pseudomonadota bacterium]
MRFHSGKVLAGAALIAFQTVNPVTQPTAQQAGTPFFAVVEDPRFCEILLTGQGTLGTNVGNTILASTQPGGQPGEAEVRVSGPGTGPVFRLSAFHPGGFTSAPTGLNPADVTTTAQFVITTTRLNGTVRGPRTRNANGTASIRLPRGSTSQVEVDYEAVNNVGPFPGGNYTGQVTLLCE